jgi:hypothetical protein
MSVRTCTLVWGRDGDWQQAGRALGCSGSSNPYAEKLATI